MTTLRVFDEAQRELEHAALTYQRERPGWGDKFIDEYVDITVEEASMSCCGCSYLPSALPLRSMNASLS
jgi:hypothetical protein